MIRRLWSGLCAFALRETSTRSAALLRIGLPLLLWARFADDMRLIDSTEPERVALGISFWLSTTLMLVGLWSRFSTLWAGLTMLAIVYGFGFGLGFDDWNHHHQRTLALATFFLAFCPTGTSLSVDRWRAVRAAERAGAPPPVERGPTWGLALIGLLLSSIYFWGAVTKTELAFLNGERLEQSLMVLLLDQYPEIPGFHAMMAVAGTTSTLLEYALSIGLWFRRTRPTLIVIGLAFHAFIYYTMPVLTFSATMALLYLATIPPDSVHTVTERLLGRGSSA